jgi:hypothetical protein
MKGIIADRFYFSKLWHNERRAFKKSLKEWFVKTLSSKERRLIVKEFYKAGLESGLFEYEVNGGLYDLFGISLFCADNHWKLVQVLKLPTWILKEIVKISCEFEKPNSWKISQAINNRWRMWIPPQLIWFFLNHLDVNRVIEAKERHDSLLKQALRNVGQVEQDFILAIEGNPDISIYEEFADRFRGLQLQNLYFYTHSAKYYTALIDSALIDLIVERAGLKPPELWRLHISEVVE